jgi:prepilin-type N-terminal cleavage/methylation domain-containing protein
MYLKKSGGFSLVELMVSLGIFAGLALSTMFLVSSWLRYSNEQNDYILSEQLVKQVVFSRVSNKYISTMNPYTSTVSDILIGDLDANGKTAAGFPGVNNGFYPSNLDSSFSFNTAVNSDDADKKVLRSLDKKVRICTYITPVGTTDRNIALVTGGTTNGIQTAASTSKTLTYSIFKAVAHPVVFNGSTYVVQSKKIIAQSSCVIKR